jgi:hypothetical protein
MRRGQAAPAEGLAMTLLVLSTPGTAPTWALEAGSDVPVVR